MDAAIDALASAHYAVIPNFLSANMQQALHNELLQQQEMGFFHEAGIGRGIQQHEMWIFEAKYLLARKYFGRSSVCF